MDGFREFQNRTLLESGLARLHQHLAGGGSVGIVSSATNDGDTPDRQRQLIRRAREHGYGPIVARGRTKEWGSESSVVIPNASLGHLKKLGNEFGQQAVIHVHNGVAQRHWLDAAGDKKGTSEEIGHAHFNQKNDLGVTVLKGAGFRPKDERKPTRSFTFEDIADEGLTSLEIPPTGQFNPLWKPYC